MEQKTQYIREISIIGLSYIGKTSSSRMQQGASILKFKQKTNRFQLSCLPSQQSTWMKEMCCASFLTVQNHIPRVRKNQNASHGFLVKSKQQHCLVLRVKGIPPSQPSSYLLRDSETSNLDELSWVCSCVDSSSLEPVSSVNHTDQKVTN